MLNFFPPIILPNKYPPMSVSEQISRINIIEIIFTLLYGIKKFQIVSEKNVIYIINTEMIDRINTFFFLNIALTILINSSNEKKLIKKSSINKFMECNKDTKIIINKNVEDKILFDISLI